MDFDLECCRCGEWPGETIAERIDALALQADEWEGKYAAVSEINAGLRVTLEQRVGELQIAMCEIERLRAELAGRDAARPIRIERVSGNSVEEFRANLSPGLHASGDCVLAWVNEGDLITAQFASAIAAGHYREQGNG